MANTGGASDEISSGSRVGQEEGTMDPHFTEEQIEVLEKAYAECSSPTHSQLSEILFGEPILSGITTRQLRVWFQNRRRHDMLCRINEELALEFRWLITASNILLRRNNALLQTQLDLLTFQNQFLRDQILALNAAAADVSPQPVSDYNNSLHALDGEINEFSSQAIGTAINWNPIPRPINLHGLGAPFEVYISSAWIGVAVRACNVLPFEPMKVSEILNGYLSLPQNFRSMNVLAQYSASGALVEYYAPTTIAQAPDLWIMSAISDYGSFLVFGRSISGSASVPSIPVILEFVRGKMPASGYLIRSCDGGSATPLVDHLDLEASSVLELVLPLYDSPETMTLSAIRDVQQLAQKTDEKSELIGWHPNYLRSFVKRFSREFSDDIHGLMEDGWSWMSTDGTNDFMPLNRTGFNATGDGSVKTLFIHHNNLPAILVKLLKDLCSAWMNSNFANHSLEFSEAANLAYPGFDTHNISEEADELSFTELENEILDVLQFERDGEHWSGISSSDLYFMQIGYGTEDTTGFGACSEPIIGQFDKNTPNDALPSKSKSGKMNRAEEKSGSSSKATPESNLSVELATLIAESYRSILGVEMLGLKYPTTDSISQRMENHQDAIICFSFSSIPVIFYANQNGLEMLGATTDDLQRIEVDNILGGSGASLASILPSIMEQGFAVLGPGSYISETNNCVAYGAVVVWQVRLFDGSLHCLAAAFTDCICMPSI